MKKTSKYIRKTRRNKTKRNTRRRGGRHVHSRTKKPADPALTRADYELRRLGDIRGLQQQSITRPRSQPDSDGVRYTLRNSVPNVVSNPNNSQVERQMRELMNSIL